MHPRDDNVHDLFHLDPDDRRWRADAHSLGWYDGGHAPDERLRHLILVDGRLVDTWVEAVAGSDWSQHARLEDERRTAQRHPAPAMAHPYDQVLDWLDSLVGGRRALEALSTAPLEMPVVPDAGLDLALVGVDDLFDSEVPAALHHGLELLSTRDPEAVVRRRTASQVAGGLCWAIGRANGLFASETRLTQKDVQRRLALSSSISGLGASVQRALRGLAPDPAPRPVRCPDLVALGDPGLLTSTTRGLLVQWRDRALAARDAHRADLRAKGDEAVLPSEVES